ncbi:MAG: ParB/RepB/Spo0J family partition protein [Treponema sp.]|nr:ParB/RepB/Spo0J family partition protein [Treponema sp.]
MGKFGLGKGLDALLPTYSEKTSEHGAVLLVPLDKIRPNPNQPRKSFDEDALIELANSIREHGIIQPIIVEEAEDGYLIVAGERRFRAARRAGLEEIPIIVRVYSEEKRLEVSLIENIHRADLNPIEEASVYKILMDLTGKTQDAVADLVGKSRSAVANALRLLKLPFPMQESLKKGEISPGHARALLSVGDPSAQEKLFKEIKVKGLSVRSAEKMSLGAQTAQTDSPRPRQTVKPKRNPHLADMEEQFIERLGTKVSIEGGLDRGVIRIEYYSMQDMERLYEIFTRQ